MTTTLPHLTGDAASLYIGDIICLEVDLLECKEWLSADFRFGCACSIYSDEDGDLSISINDPLSIVTVYWSVEEARRIVDAINAAIAYVESSKGGAQ